MVHPEQQSPNPKQKSTKFEEGVATHRHELEVHCYRILGSALDAEDAVQETLLRAYRGLDTFRTDISFRAWLYKIATNVCFDMIKIRKRSLPRTEFPSRNPSSPLPEMVLDPHWIEPFPTSDSLDSRLEQNPASRYEYGEAISLAFITALQLLSPYQRSVLILRDVLGFRAREAALILDASLSAVNSALHRARTNIRRGYTEEQATSLPMQEPLLERYLLAWEAADIDQLVELLQEEASLSMPPWPVWFAGRTAIREILSREVFGQSEQTQDRLVPMQLNGQPGFAMYRRADAASRFDGLGFQVLNLPRRGNLIKSVDIFLMPALFAAFKVEDHLD